MAQLSRSTSKLQVILSMFLLWVLPLVIHHLAPAATLAEEREAGHARRFLDEGRQELAVSQCQQFLERFPASSLADQVLDLEGRALQAIGRPAEAGAAWQNLAGRYADSPLAPAALLSAGDCQVELGRPREAVKVWQRLAQRYPQSPLAAQALLKAEALTPREERAARLDLLRGAMELDAESEWGLEARYRWALLLEEEGQDEAALNLLERVSAEAAPGPLNLAALLRGSSLLERAQRRDEALQALLRPLGEYEDSPSRSALWLAVARLRMEQGRMEEAERGLRADLELEDPALDPAAPRDSLRLLLGDALARQGRCEEAVETWDSCGRQSLEVQARQAWCLGQVESWALAAERWAAVADSLGWRVSLTPPDQRLLATALAGVARAQEETGLAQLSWERVAELSVSMEADAPEALPLAGALLRQGLPEAAAGLLGSREDPPAQADRRGLLRLRQALAVQDWPRAVELARIFHERWPASPLAAEAESLSVWQAVPRARAAELKRRLKELGARRSSDQLRAQLEKGWLQLRELRQPRAALQAFEGMPVDASSDAQAEALLGRLQAHLALGDPVAARDDWEERDRLLARSPWALAALRELWRRDPAPGPEHLRERIALLESLRQNGRVDGAALAGEFLLQWNGLREAVAAQGGSAAVQNDCARKALAWADSLNEPDAPLMMAAGLCHLALDDKASAGLIWQRLLNEQDEDPIAVEAARRLAQLPDESGATRAAVAERMAGEWLWHPLSAPVRQEIAVAERKAGRPEVALAICEQLLAEELGSASPVPPAREATPALLDETARCEEALGRDAEARTLWLRALAAYGPADSAAAARTLLSVARSFHAGDRVADAQAICRSLCATYPDRSQAVRAAQLLAAMDSGQGRHEEALETLEGLKPARSTDLGLRVQWVRALYRCGLDGRARPEYQRLLKESGGRVDEDTLMASLNLAKGLGALDQGRAAEAEKAFTLIVEKLGKTPQAAAAQLGLGRAQLAQGRTTPALKTLAVLDRRWPQSLERAAAAGLRGQLAERAGNASQTLKELEQVAALNKGEARREALGALIEAASRLSRRQDETRALERYLEEFPEAPDAMARRIEQARLLSVGGNAAEARAAYRALQAEAGDDYAAEIQFRLGETAEAARDLPGAILEYEKAPHMADRSRLDWDASALFAAARCWDELGRSAEAELILQRIIELKGENSGHGQRARTELQRLHLSTKSAAAAGEAR